MNASNTTVNRAIFYNKDYQNAIRDSCEQGLLSVGMFHRLDKYADPNFAKHNAYWVEDGSEAILCERTSGPRPLQLVLETTGLLWRCHLTPFMNEETYAFFLFKNVLRKVSERVNVRLLREDHLGGPGHQSVALAGVGQWMHEQSRKAIEVLHVLASFRRPVDALKDYKDVELDGEPVIYANLPVCTPIHQLQEDAEPTMLDSDEDPNGVIARFAERHDAVVTTDNIVHFSLAEQLRHADQFRFHKCSGALFRHGQVVKAKLGFRIVEEDGKYAMRTDLLELAIINEDIAQALAFSNRMDQNATTNRNARSHKHRSSTVAKHSRQQEHANKARNKPVDNSADVKDFINLPFNGTL